MSLLSKDKKDENGKVIHQAIKCSGVNHCEYAYEELLRPCLAYDRVKLENINHIRRKASRINSQQVNTEIRGQTEAFFNAYSMNWNNPAIPRCQHPRLGIRICADQKMALFRKNNVRHVFSIR